MGHVSSKLSPFGSRPSREASTTENKTTASKAQNLSLRYTPRSPLAWAAGRGVSPVRTMAGRSLACSLVCMLIRLALFSTVVALPRDQSGIEGPETPPEDTDILSDGLAYSHPRRLPSSFLFSYGGSICQHSLPESWLVASA